MFLSSLLRVVVVLMNTRGLIERGADHHFCDCVAARTEVAQEMSSVKEAIS